MDGAQENVLNPIGSALSFGIKGASFSNRPDGVQVLVNDRPVPSGQLRISAARVDAPVTLFEGRNDISFKGYDDTERPVFLRKTVWAGSNQLKVNVVDSRGVAVTSGVRLTLSLGDDAGVASTLSAASGQAIFSNVPDRAIVVEAHTDDDRAGTVGGHGAAGELTVRLLDFNSADLTENNDFSQGLAGFVVNAARVALVPHVESVGPSLTALRTAAVSGARASVRQVRAASATVLGAGSSLSGGADAGDLDAQLSTFDQTPQTMSRTFRTKPGTTRVAVRYRFLTGEIPSGYYGSEFNDYFSISVRARNGRVSSGWNTVNRLGLAAFDANGSTAWRTLGLNTEPAGEDIQVDLMVANAGDGANDSHLVIDAIEEQSDGVASTLSWNPEEGGLKLTYTVGSKPLSEPVSVDVYWALSPDPGSRIGQPIASIVVPAGTAAGASASRNIAGNALQDNPAEATYIVASAGSSVASIADVELAYAPNASPAAVSPDMKDVIKDALRAAGTMRAILSRTALSPADQARAMFQGLVRSPGPLSANVANQLALYPAAGDAVINIFTNMTAGGTIAQAGSNAASIMAAMEQEIRRQGPGNVSAHCADPASASVADLPLANFSAAGRAMFRRAIGSRARLTDEADAFHLELTWQQ